MTAIEKSKSPLIYHEPYSRRIMRTTPKVYKKCKQEPTVKLFLAQSDFLAKKVIRVRVCNARYINASISREIVPSTFQWKRDFCNDFCNGFDPQMFQLECKFF